MIHRRFTWALCSLFSLPAPIPSLMFTDKEVGQVMDNRAHPPQQTNTKNTIACNGILYENNNVWSVWLNGVRFTPKENGQRTNPIHILQVSPTHVTLLWTKGEHQKRFTLKANERCALPGTP